MKRNLLAQLSQDYLAGFKAAMASPQQPIKDNASKAWLEGYRVAVDTLKAARS